MYKCGCISNKVCYPSKEEAEEAVSKLINMARCYPCPACGHYHLNSSKSLSIKKEKDAKNRNRRRQYKRREKITLDLYRALWPGHYLSYTLLFDAEGIKIPFVVHYIWTNIGYKTKDIWIYAPEYWPK